MLGLIVLGLMGIIALITIGLLVFFIVPRFLAWIPIVIIGTIAWVLSGIRWLAGLGRFIIVGAVSLLTTIFHILF